MTSTSGMVRIELNDALFPIAEGEGPLSLLAIQFPNEVSACFGAPHTPVISALVHVVERFPSGDGEIHVIAGLVADFGFGLDDPLDPPEVGADGDDELGVELVGRPIVWVIVWASRQVGNLFGGEAG